MGGARMADHWARERPWRPGQSLWALYVTCGSIPPVVTHASQFQERLSGMRGLDLVDPRWLHMTVLGVAFTEEVEPAAMARLADRVTAIAAAEPPMELVAEAPRARTDAVWMPVRATRSVGPLRNDLEQAVTSCLGRKPHALPLPLEGFRPHISIAYSNAEAPLVDDVNDRLGRVDLPPVHFRVSHLSLIRLRREAPRWSWDAEQRIPFGGNAVP